jgi:hypothetical protein
MVSANNDVVQLLRDRTAIASSSFHFSPVTSGATFDGSTNWTDMGTLDPGSPSMALNKEITDVMTGSPMTNKQQHINAYNGTMGGEIIDYNNTAFNATIGTTVNMTINSPMGWTDVEIDTGTHTRTSFDIDDVSALAVGDRIAVELGDALYTWFEDKEIASIVPDATPATSGTVTIKGQLSEAPIAGAAVKKVESIANLIGGNTLREYQARMLFSFNDGSTMVVHAPRGNFTGEMSPNPGDGTTVARIPFEFQILGTATTVPGFSCPQVTLATHYAFYNGCV